MSGNIPVAVPQGAQRPFPSCAQVPPGTLPDTAKRRLGVSWRATWRGREAEKVLERAQLRNSLFHTLELRFVSGSSSENLADEEQKGIARASQPSAAMVLPLAVTFFQFQVAVVVADFQ